MARFFVAPGQIRGNRAVIIGEDVKHIRKVLRLNRGDKISLADGTGKEYLSVIEDYNGSQVICKIEAVREMNTEAPVKVILVQGLPKGDKMELIIQKCTEIGVSKIIPLNTERVVVKLDSQKADQRRERWQRVAGEASKQAGRAIVPHIEKLMDFDEALIGINEEALALIPWEEEGNHSLKGQLKEYKKNLEGLAEKEIYIFIGPEGGFSKAEVERAKGHGVQPVTLGPRILRTETAGMAALTMVLYELGDLGGLG